MTLIFLKNIRWYTVVKKKFYSPLAFLGKIFFPVLFGGAFLFISQGILPQSVFVESMSSEITKAFVQKSCATSFDGQEEYDFLSLACEGNFTLQDRQAVLDIFFKNKLYLKKETYRLEGDNGFYLYKLEAANLQKPLYVKFYFRNAALLWPNHEGMTKSLRLALVVGEVQNPAQVIQWQSLGIPVNYAIDPFARQAQPTARQVREYAQSLWLDMSYQNKPVPVTYGHSLTIQQALDEEQLNRYMDNVLSIVKNPDGVITGKGNYFSEHTYAVRKLIENLKARKIPLVLDENKVSRISYATAEILGQQAYWVDFIISKEQSFDKIWTDIESSSRSDSLVVIKVQADNMQAFRFLYDVLQKKKNLFHFMFLKK